MALVLVLASFRSVKRFGLADAVPNGPGPLNPLVIADLVIANQGHVLAGLAEDQQVVGECWTQPRAVLLLLHKQQALVLCPDRLGLRILVDAHLAVVDPALRLVMADQVTPEVLDADHP